MARTTGGNAQDRRRRRRAASRRTKAGVANLRPDDLLEIQALVAAASGATSLPLSDRDVTWDAATADKRVRDWAGATDAPNAKYARAFFVKQDDGTNFGDYKLGYADVVDGKLVANWKGITAVAGVLQGARGGADITDAEASATKSKVESYYAKARTAYDDSEIQVPWADDKKKSASTAEALSRRHRVSERLFAALRAVKSNAESYSEPLSSVCDLILSAMPNGERLTLEISLAIGPTGGIGSETASEASAPNMDFHEKSSTDSSIRREDAALSASESSQTDLAGPSTSIIPTATDVFEDSSVRTATPDSASSVMTPNVSWPPLAIFADALASAETSDSDEYLARLGFWVVELGGKPSKGTNPDKRLKENKQPMAAAPEEAVLDALDAYQAAVVCSCGHAFSEHSGAGGTCSHADGRGTCRCGEFAYPNEDPDARELATAYVKIRPDLEGFEAEVERFVRRVIRDTLVAAVGDVAWAPEDGFRDLLCDVNEQLAGGSDAAASYDYDDIGPMYSGPRAVDASVKLDKVLICDGDDDFVAPITIDATGEPVLSDRSDWIPVEEGMIEVAPDADDDAMTARERIPVRFALRDVVTADGAVAPTIPVEHQPAEVLPEASQEPIPAEQQPAPAGGAVRWTATFVPEATLTEDGRAFAPGSLILPPAEGSRDLPLTLMAMIETSAEGGHDGAKVAGRIDQLWREGNLVKAAGVFSEEEYGQMIARMVGTGELRGLSVDIAPLEWERTPASDWFDQDGNWIAQQGDDGEWITAGEEPTLEDAVERLFGGGEDMILVITKGVIGMATVCPFPAFGQASISLTASGNEAPLVRYSGQAGFVAVQEPTHDALVASVACDCETETELVPVEEEPEDLGLTAAAAGLAPAAPPVEWFENPDLEELTPLTITDDGRVYGHAWGWETCHLSFDGCVVAPRSRTDYAYFQLGELECDEGERISVGKITLDTGHAGQRLSRAEATRHYDHTGTVAAYVAFGEDEHGGWFAGSICPDLPEGTLRKLRGATISGDWRGVDGNLELIALLAVNVPGFPVPRPRAIVAAGGEYEDGEPDVLVLTAAGIVGEGLSAEQTDEIRELAAEAEA